MDSQQLPLDSEALRVNLAGTAQQVVIPDRYLPLLQAVANLYGVRTPLSETLAEYFHTFRNADLLIDGFQTVLLRNWTYFEHSEDRSRAFALLSELVLNLLETPLSDGQTSLLLRQLLTWCSSALSGPHPDAYDDSLMAVAACLTRLLPSRSLAFLERDALLRELTEQAVTQPHLSEPFCELYRSLLLVGYRRIAERLPIPDWAVSQQAELTDAQAVADRFSFLATHSLHNLIDAAEAASGPELLSPSLPTHSALLAQAIDDAFQVDYLEDRFAVYLYFLKDDTFAFRQNEVMGDLLGVVRQLIKPTHNMDVERILTRLTRFFRARRDQFLLMRFQCYEAVGVAIGEAGNAAAADHVINDLLSWRFQYPEVQGATDDWETVANPYHVPKIRCWMHIIESNPPLYERLAAALNVQLRLGGVHIADTDLFQRDVTRFLNANIKPIYFVARQLLRAFPVYFNDVGAEGELRSVTTELDEAGERRDTLMHFLRKQSHAESSNRLIPFSQAILVYWTNLDASGLEPFLSVNGMRSVKRERGWAEGPHAVLTDLWKLLHTESEGATSDEVSGDAGPSAKDATGFIEQLVAMAPTTLEEHLDRCAGVSAKHETQDRRRVALMVRTYQLLIQKYSLAADNVMVALNRDLLLDAKTRQEFVVTLAAWREHPTPPARDRLLDISLTALEHLKSIILDPTPSSAVENIYQKRHIAAGIPSMYGTYTEPKFDALGLSFRLENLVSRLLEDSVAETAKYSYITRDSLRRMAATLRRFERALAIDGIDSRRLSTNLRLLEASFSSNNFTFHQYHNVFQFLAHSVSELSRTSILSHDQVLHTVLMYDPRQCEIRNLSVDATAEMVLRKVLVSALGMQNLDRYVSSTLRKISTLAGRLGKRSLTRMMNYDPERLVSFIYEPKPSTDDQMTLGFKGLGLKQMASYKHRVPEGFILTTELFNAYPAMSYRPLYHDTVDRIRLALGRLENQTGLRLGDPARLLTLSIRSGAAISMPGLMTTFVDVGLNDELATALSRRPGFEWAAWDSYRRFLQSWAMAGGVNRDFFDGIMMEFKTRHGIERKLDFTAEQMRDLALTYKARAGEMGIRFAKDPFRQVTTCIEKVLKSWDSPEATVYRNYLGVADEWGTAVIVQRMVFGNISRSSGSGVTFTRNPREPHSSQVRLFGDFTPRSQGEDLVGGLVFPHPISEAQRLSSATYRGTEHSLERDYPEVYQALLEVAQDLVQKREHDPQEIEFTFESASGKDLYILQKRAMVYEQTPDAPYFDTTSPHYGPPVAVGMGVAGGAYSGRIAINAQHIEHLLESDSNANIVLLRPDTVPEDIAMITRVNGLLTCRGGATSHAAVTAKRLAKTAVVDCRELEVDEHDGTVRLAGGRLVVGDWLSLDGRTGNIFLGRIPTVTHPPTTAQAATAY
ncbi:MAG: PEP/pyruvate-binding domain-containing protein [Thermoleophilia bacterium]|jgi:pyruvate,orthophosphate dikinase